MVGNGIVTHIAGVEVNIENRWLRQRCSWCGAILSDYDLATMASCDGSGPCSFEVGVMIDVSGLNPVYLTVNTSQKLPDTFCGHEETNG